MWELIHNKQDSSSVAQRMAEMREELMSIGEKERILRERNADREAYRYLLDAHRLLVRQSLLGEQLFNISHLEQARAAS